jgi:hypothetical protein
MFSSFLHGASCIMGGFVENVETPLLSQRPETFQVLTACKSDFSTEEKLRKILMES